MGLLLAASLVNAPPANAGPNRSVTKPSPPPKIPDLTVGLKPMQAVHDAAVTAAQQRAQKPAPLPKTRTVAGEADNPTYDAPTMPQRMPQGEEDTVEVTVTNTTAAALPAKQWVLSYRWKTRENRDVTSPANQRSTPLPGDLAPGAKETLKAKVKAPDPLFGNSREEFTLSWDLYNTATRKWLSSSGVETLDQDVTVEDPTSGQLGLEKFYQYSGLRTGSGSNVQVNQFSGNAFWGTNPFSHPSRGPASFLRLAYNSLDTSDVYAGPGWTISASSVQRLGTPLQFGAGLPGVVGYPATITLVDGDGTSHVYKLNKHGSLDTDKWTYDSPAGVHLYLQKNARKGDRAWVMTKPDRTRFYFDDQGYQTFVVDKNGNTLTFTYDRTIIGGRNTGLLKHITDATGRRTLTVDYYQRGDSFWHFVNGKKLLGTGLSLDPIINKVKSITDVSGRRIDFVYSDHGLLSELIDGAQDAKTAKTFGFAYDQKLLENPKLIAVTDPMGRPTKVGYSDQHGRRWVHQLTDRRGKSTGFGYTDPDGTGGSKIQSTVADANGRTSTYLIDGFGRPERVTDPKGQTTQLTWDADNNVRRLEEANGAVTTRTFDPKTGYPLEIRDPEAVKNGGPPTRLTYRVGLDGHTADLATKTSAEGRKWTFAYDDRGNLVSVTDPKGVATPEEGDYTTRYSYGADGLLAKATDANGHATEYGDYDPSGYPKTITDALGNRTTTVYDVLGAVVSATDARGKTSTYTYDGFGRPLSTKVPKDQDAGVFVFTPGPAYDKNDNVVRYTAADGATSTNTYNETDLQVSGTTPGDAEGDAPRHSTLVYDNVGNILRQTEPRGNQTDDPDDFTTVNVYDELNRLIKVTDAKGGVTTAAYDGVGNLRKVVDARRNATPDPNDYTTTFDYDLDRRPVRMTDAAGKSVTQTRDRDGLVTGKTDENGETTHYDFDERGKLVAMRVPHRKDGDTVVVRTVKYKYDQTGNRTKVITPRGTETDDPDDFVYESVYDELNRVKEKLTPFDTGDGQVGKPDKTVYSYDPVGNLSKVSAPPSSGETTRNDTLYTHYDNGWIKSSTDPWNIVNTYDYDLVGNQTKNTLTSAGGSVSRTMDWEFYPSGNLARRSDQGVPVGRDEVVVDDSQAREVATNGGWTATRSAPGAYAQGTSRKAPEKGDGQFTWQLTIPRTGTYEVFVRYPKVAGAATDATYTIGHSAGSATKRLDQSRGAGGWTSLGAFPFNEGRGTAVTLSGKATGTAVADAVKLVRDNSEDVDNERKEFFQRYDANNNLIQVDDRSPGARIGTYALDYDELDRLTRLQEKAGDTTRNTTVFTYDENGNTLTRTHDDVWSQFEYDERDLLAKATNAKSPSDTDKNVTTYAYTATGAIARQVKPNGNAVDFTYLLDGSLLRQIERRKDGGPTVADHTFDYTPNGDPAKEVAKVMNADDNSATIDNTFTFDYDPRDRIKKVVKSGDRPVTETYTHDANNNVLEQKIGETVTKHEYDRNRLVSTTVDGVSSTHKYDPLGRLDTVTSEGQTTTKYRYDGFDRVAENTVGTGANARKTVFSYDPFDRTATQATSGGGQPDKKTVLNYLGLSDDVLSEEDASKIVKRYQTSPFGEKLTQIKTDDGKQEISHYVYHPKGDVEALTKEDGNTRVTYGYTAYGKNDDTRFTGADKPDPQNPGKEPYNSYRFNGHRFDQASGTYDMGFRNYDPGLNRFLTRDMYAGALDDLQLSTDPFTGSRYAFAGGNPISNVELDGHGWYDWVSNIGHAVLDVAGFVPVVGDALDLVNAAWYGGECIAGREGACGDAALSAGAAIPFLGWGAGAAKVGKWGKKIYDAVDTASDGGRRADDLPPVHPPKDPAPPVKDPAPPAKDPTPPAKDPAPPAKDPAPPAKDPAPPAKDPAPPAKQPDAPSCPIPNSFPAGTQVLMADGSYRRIEDVKRGDRVMATDVENGRRQARTVTDTITSAGIKQFAKITFGPAGEHDGERGGEQASLVATAGHPFWVPDRGVWVDAGQLQPGMWLRTSAGTWLQVTAVEKTLVQQRVHNLTVGGTHTYHVRAGDADLLVHNANPAGCGTPKGGVYALVTESGVVVRTGMATDLADRARKHAKTYPDLKFRVLYRSDDRDVRRGLEEMVENWYSPILAKQSAIDLKNPKRARYIAAAQKFLSEL
ncbi:golvesin C-terminal-like domain-containing protein [Actinomadura rudentiformis]|nr:polymorphic toxin-type HINT domain-containing protein [Actinomadura rudentiformis]